MSGSGLTRARGAANVASHKVIEEVITLIRLPRKTFAVLAGIVLVAAACSSGSATLPPAGSTSAAGATSAPAGASTAPAVATLNPNDPSSIITQVISGGTAVKSFHIEITVAGTIKASALSGAAGGAGSALTGDMKLDGTKVTGDVDVANQAAHIAANVPLVTGGTTLPVTADVILTGGALYYKASLTGPKYTKVDLASLGSSLGSLGALASAVPTPGASAMGGVTDEIAQLRAALDQAGAKATLVGVDQIGGKDADHINISVPLDLLNSQIAAAAAAASGAPAGMKIDSASVDLWVYKDSYLPAKFEIKGASSALGNLDFTVTITNYDQPVTITAPAASDIQAPTS
jgi:hypothetical protein